MILSTIPLAKAPWATSSEQDVAWQHARGRGLWIDRTSRHLYTPFSLQGFECGNGYVWMDCTVNFL
jgi:hypothetical protein